MKLRNKKTGEIIELLAKPSFVKRNDNYLQSELNSFNSLAELNEEWEDYEEPKEYWYIEPDGSIIQCHKPTYINHLLDGLKSIGNYFETKEEAEKAVEKLKAWKRLKDNGFKFDEWERDKEFSGDYIIKDSDYHTCDDKDLDSLFGGEE